MDILFFLNQRTRFIRQLYELSAIPFQERIRKIEAGEEPYVQPYSESEEPTFESDWTEAYESLQILGYAGISMLAASLHLFVAEWEKQLRLKCCPQFKPHFKKGWFQGYSECFLQKLGINWQTSGTNLELLEQIVMARNRAQHAESITEVRVKHCPADVKKHKTIFFIDDFEKHSLASFAGTDNHWFMSSITVTRAQFTTAIDEVEKFAAWLDKEILKQT